MIQFEIVQKSHFSNRQISVSVKLKAGLGNRLFQLAAAAFYADTHKVDLVIYDDLVEDPVHDGKANDYLWTIVKAKHVSGPVPEAQYVSGLHDDLLNHKRTSGLVILDGYFQDPRYAAALRQYCETYLHDVCKRIPKRSSIFVHVRLGDYERQAGNLHYTQIETYYNKAIAQMGRAGTTFEIYSNTPQRAENFLQKLTAYDSVQNRVAFGPNTDAQSTLESMMTCAGGIIANSTYSWWAGQFLLWTSNTARIMVPEPWVRLTFVPNVLWRLSRLVEPVQSMNVADDNRWTLVKYQPILVTTTEMLITMVIVIVTLTLILIKRSH